MIHLYSGDGKGKTSIVTGMAVRMAGAGKKVIFAQFMKGNESSELKMLKMLPGIRILKADAPFGFYKDMTEEDKLKITGFHNEILRVISDRLQEYRGKRGIEPELLVVLDEITYPCQWDLLDEGLLKRILTELPETVELAMTGRNPADYMIKMSDYWSEVGMKKHPYEKNIMARKGIEF